MQLFAGELTNQNREYYKVNDNKQLLDEVFVICRIINVEVRVIEPKARQITLAETLIIPHITKTESDNCFIIHCKRRK